MRRRDCSCHTSYFNMDLVMVKIVQREAVLNLLCGSLKHSQQAVKRHGMASYDLPTPHHRTNRLPAIGLCTAAEAAACHPVADISRLAAIW